ncbi:MAG TPA: hypothetical protein VND64_09220 [Pirellulales bacterium]|nr:hypothetical protein [Pirellulales bacterium]
MLLLTKMPRRFTLAQLLMAVALASILLALYTSLSDLGGSGKPFHVVETVVFSPDGKYLAASMYNGCDSHVKMKSYVSDNRISNSPATTRHEFLLRALTPSETFALSRDAKLLATLDGGNITLWDLDAMQKTSPPQAEPG